MSRTHLFFFTFVIAQVLFTSQGYSQALTPETALQGYLNNGDKAYRWELKETYSMWRSKSLQPATDITTMA